MGVQVIIMPPYTDITPCSAEHDDTRQHIVRHCLGNVLLH